MSDEVSSSASSSSSVLDDLAREILSDFSSNQRIMSFGQFMESVAAHPERHARSAMQYLRDCIAHYGVTQSEDHIGERWHYHLFDAPFDGNRDAMFGQQHAQRRVYQLLDSFARAGKSDKLVLLHGPNGSAKSTFVKTLMRGLEHYSQVDEGAIYCFNWIFPSERLASSKGSIGFNDSALTKKQLETFADLDESQIDVKLVDPLRDHPLLLIPVKQRGALLEKMLAKAGAKDFVVSEHLLRGDLSHTNKKVFDALLTAYHGDLQSVYKHIQVERFYISRRYRRGAVSVEPQMRVDAGVRQLTMDRRLQALPPVLQSVSLFEVAGDLADANRGIIEYDDLFKRHPDLNKYLLTASERAAVSLEHLILYLDMVLIATGNETYLDAFKQTADYASFKGRVELVRVPYLLDYTVEQGIYDDQLERVDLGKFVAPLTTYVAALWAVLTRLKRPNVDRFEPVLKQVLTELSPLEKADLYASGEVPEGLNSEEARELKAAIKDLLEDGARSSAYEGRFGASPREMKMIMLNAAQNDAYPCLSPLAIFDELEQLIKDPTVFPFLQMQADGDYFDHASHIETVRGRYLELLDEHMQEAMGLVDERQYERLFARYIDHVSQSIKGEQVYNDITGQYEEPDEDFMEELEEQMDLDADEREALISRIAAAFIDNPGESLDYRRVFPQLFTSLKRSFYDERRRQIRKVQQQILRYFNQEESTLSSQELAMVKRTVETLKERFGYNEESIREALAFLLAKRYKGVEHAEEEDQ